MNPAHIQALVHQFNWHQPSWDLFIISFWLVASVVYAFAAGKGRSLSILVSVYIAKLLVLEAPFLSAGVGTRLHVASVYIQELVAFIVLFLILFMFLARYAFKSSADGKAITSLLFTLVFAVLQVGLLINIVLGFLPVETRATFAPLIQFIFIQKAASFIWLVLPIVYLVFLGKFISDRTEL